MCVGGKGFLSFTSPQSDTRDRQRLMEGGEGLFQYQKSRLVYSSRQSLDKSLVQGIVPDSAVMQV